MSLFQALPPAGLSATPRYSGPERRRLSAPVRSAVAAIEPVLPVMPAPPADPRALDDRCRALDEVQEAVCAAISGEAPLFDLVKRRVLMLCARRPEVRAAAAAELERLLAVDILQRHFHACHKRRRLQRELAELAAGLRAGVGQG